MTRTIAIMHRYSALTDGEKGGYGVSFPDLPGVVAMDKTIEEAMVHAEESLRDYAIEAKKDDAELTMPRSIEGVKAPAGKTLISIPMIR